MMNKILLLSVISILLFCAPVFADYAKGLDAAQKGDFVTALKEWKPLAEQGDDAGAQYGLGVMYSNGHGVIRDYKATVKWYTLAAEQGHVDAQHNLGLMYRKGQDVIQDYKAAFKWYKLAAEQEDAKAQQNLGVMYSNGHGVIQDYTRAHMWWNIAASQGDKYSVKNRDSIAKKMTPSQIEKAQTLARECVAKKYKDC
jgi:tetratricopeptide (TPR) repeat protein